MTGFTTELPGARHERPAARGGPQTGVAPGGPGASLLPPGADTHWQRLQDRLVLMERWRDACARAVRCSGAAQTPAEPPREGRTDARPD
ncbi:unnamed protein product [Gemmataceae bacterium]|nr:unnamed protein product [Gemmataceae bacterium]VTT99021.1 unnamed protein product [Gemmataceae bacterium]